MKRSTALPRLRWVIEHCALLGLLLTPFATLKTLAEQKAGTSNAAHQAAAVIPARPPVIAGTDIRFYRTAAGDGLSQVKVSQIVQDAQGFMWFGTQYGLNRYDGYRFKVFLHDATDPDSLSGVYITALFKDKAGSIWVACGQFLDRYDPIRGSFVHYPIRTPEPQRQHGAITHISQDDAGLFWLATNNGLYKFDPAAGLIDDYRHSESNPFSLSSSDIKSSGEDREGNFWVVTRAGLDQFDRSTGRVLVHIPLSENRESFFYEDSYGTSWLVHASGAGLAVLDRKHNKLIPVLLHNKPTAATSLSGFVSILEDRDRVLWLGSAGYGLFRFDREHNRFIQYRNQSGDPYSLAENTVPFLYEDREENIWVGMGEQHPNLFSKKKLPFQPFPVQPGIAGSDNNKLVGSILKDHHGDVWIGQRTLRRIRRGRGSAMQIDAFENTKQTISMNEDHAGVLWAGTFGDGIYRVDEKTGRLKNYLHQPSNPSSLSSNIVTSLVFDHAGTLWAATWDGLDRFDQTSGRFTVYKPRSETVPLFIGMAEDQQGILWLGTDSGGLERFDPSTGQFRAYEHDAGNPATVSDSRVNSVFIDHAGGIWLATQNGLDKFDPTTGKVTAYYERDGLSGNVVACMREDDQGKLWMSTNKGISGFDPVSHVFRNYFPADGLPGADMTGWPACSQGSDGELLYGGFAGGVAFYPNLIRETTSFPPVVLTDLRVAGRAVKPGKESLLQPAATHASDLLLDHDQTMLSVEFAALSYLNPAATRYRYKLETLDRDWNQVGSSQRVVTYSSLPAGKFAFRVQAATARGDWGEPGVTLGIEIQPAWWNTWWFRSAYVLLVLLSVWCLYWYRVRQLAQQYAIRLEERVSERTRIARELHDTLLQGFHGLMLRFHVATEMVTENPKARGVMVDALDRADALMSASRDRIRELRHENGPDLPLAEAFAEAGRQLQPVDPIALSIVVVGTVRELRFMIREELLLIGKEAIANAFSHSQGSKVEVELEYSDSAVRLRIRDDGKGMPQETLRTGGLTGHWGLSGMRERSERIGARFRVWNRSGAGVEVEVTVPRALAYDHPPRSSFWSAVRRSAGRLASPPPEESQ